MFDIHNHVLPGVDDGPESLTSALLMLETARAQGITHVACTPHSNDRVTDETDRCYQSVFLNLRGEAKKHGLDIELSLASEIMIGPDVVKTMKRTSGTYCGAGKYALIEFSIETPFEIIQNVIAAIRRAKIWPVIAHYERFARAQRNAEQPLALRKAGAVITLDAGSLVGQFGNVLTKRARQLLNWNCVDILASDAHNDSEHGFFLKAGLDVAAREIGADAAHKLVLDNPQRVWEGLPWMVGAKQEGGAA